MYISCNITCIYICIIIDHTDVGKRATAVTAADENGVFANNKTS